MCRSHRWAAIAALGLAGCGDNTGVDPVFTATSGSRLALQWYGYDDGTLQPEAEEFYDTLVHARCVPELWVDSVVRCVPEIDEAVYADAGCQRAVGLGVTIKKPGYFLGHDQVGGRSVPARLYRAGAKTTAIAQYYQRIDGACVGRSFAPRATTYELVAELAAWDVVALRDGEVGDGRVGVRVREADDGLRVPTGLRDRELDVACIPTVRPDGAVTCDPSGAAPAEHFSDPSCNQPVILVADPLPPPPLAAVVELSGCASYHAVGTEVSTPLYRRAGEACVPTAKPLGQRVFSIEPSLELPALGRTIEDVADRRLQRIILSDTDLRFADDRLYDTATRATCQRQEFAEVTRCSPAATVAATVLYTAGCAIPVLVAEVAQRTCERIAFATATGADGIEIHAIGDRPVDPLYYYDAGLCQPYPDSPGTVVRGLGPPIDPETFMAAVYFGER